MQVAFAQSELEVRSSIEASVQKAFLSRNYALLESEATEFRSTKARTPSGIWKLTVFYWGINKAIERETNYNPQNFDAVYSIAAGWVAAYPKSPTAHIVESRVMYNQGMAFRGRGFANEVNPAAWQPFTELVAKAKDNLEKYKAVASVDPEWYLTMLTVARLQRSPSSCRYWMKV